MPDTTPTRMKRSMSMPAAAMPAGSVQRRPSIHSIVSTRPEDSAGYADGIFTVGSPAKLSPKSVMLRA